MGHQTVASILSKKKFFLFYKLETYLIDNTILVLLRETGFSYYNELSEMGFP